MGGGLVLYLLGIMNSKLPSLFPPPLTCEALIGLCLAVPIGGSYVAVAKGAGLRVLGTKV